MFTFNDDRTVTLGLVAKNGSGPRSVTLREPSLSELLEMRRWGKAVDEQCPTVPVPNIADATTADMVEYQRGLNERDDLVYADEPPYALALLRVINLLATEPVEVGLDDLEGWAASPTSFKQIMNHFKAPLAGQG